MPVTVRPALVNDASIIAEFNRRLAMETEALMLDPVVLAAGVQAILADQSRGLYFVAEQHREVVGQLMITYEWSDWRNGWIWWLQSVYVRADMRGHGVFRAIFDFARERAREQGDIVAIRLYVEKENRTAQTTYQSLGFHEMHFQLYQRTPV
jgi:GNAT superfamily N-acetyltransferase